MKLVIHVDGGARGNPGPAAVGAVLADPDGQVVDELAERIGVATNNVAEYRAVLLAISRAAELGADEVELINDSELVAKQLTGAYKVKHPAMKPLYQQARAAPGAVWALEHPQRPPRPERTGRLVGQRGSRRPALKLSRACAEALEGLR